MSQNNSGEKMLKGRMAETLVEELLKKSGNAVYRFGYEAIMQNLSQIQQSFDRHTEAGERIRAIPDFIVIDLKGEPIFLEVKYRWNAQLHDDDKERLERINKFWKAKIVIVNRLQKPFFRISDPPYIDEKGDIECKPLVEETAWKIDKDIYTNFESLVEKYLAPALISK